MSAWRTTLLSFTIGYDVVKQEGLGALMKGANIFATKRVFDWASRYYPLDPRTIPRSTDRRGGWPSRRTAGSPPPGVTKIK